MFFWKEEYNTDIKEIDKQHRELFRIANEAHDLLKDSFRTDKYDRIIEIIINLKAYSEYHFDYEEKRMLESGYKRFFSHKMAHDKFKQKVNSLDLKSIDIQQTEAISGLLELLYSWIVDHILNTDKDYVGKLI